MKHEIKNTIPIDMAESLLEGSRQLHTPAGEFSLSGLNNLRYLTIVIRHSSSGSSRDGYACTPGITPILAAPRELQLFGVLVWVPAANRYAYYDEDDTQDLLPYPEGLTWQTIEANPLTYLCPPTDMGEIEDSSHWRSTTDGFAVIPKNIDTLAESIIKRSSGRAAAAQAFVQLYEHTLTEFPLSPYLTDAYGALINIYMALAEECMRCRSTLSLPMTRKIIHWLKQCVVVLNRVKAYEPRPNIAYSSIFMRLSFWYSEIGKFKAARRYAKAWKAYDPTMSIPYERLLSLITLKEVIAGSCLTHPGET